MRPLLARLHRWFGLCAALFLAVAGLTGALIAWHEELDAWLNPELFVVESRGSPLPALELAARVERWQPNLRVRYVPLALEPGAALVLWVEPRTEPRGGQPIELGFDQVMVNPYSGKVLGTREWGAPVLQRSAVLPFLYKLHYSLHLPDAFGFETGTLLMGIIAMAWTLDSLVALWLSFPNLRRWRKSFAFRLRAGTTKLTFDFHRSGGVWTFPFLFMLALTAVSMNLKHEIVRPVVSAISPLTPDLFDEPARAQPVEPALSREQAVELARAEARKQCIAANPGGIFYALSHNAYGVGFFASGKEYDGGLGDPWIYIDAGNGTVRGAAIPGGGSAGDVFIQAQFPLHSGRIAGLTGRILVSLMGLAVAVLSLTGILLWARKRRARKLVAARRTAGAHVSADALALDSEVRS